MAEQLEFYFPKTKSKHMAMPTTGKKYPSKGGTVRFGVQASMNGSMSLPKYVKEEEFYDYGFGKINPSYKYPQEFIDAHYHMDSNPMLTGDDSNETVELAYQAWYQKQAENEVLNAEVSVGEKKITNRKDYDIDNELSGFSNMEVGDIDLEDYEDEITEAVEGEVIEAIRESVDDNMPISDGESVSSNVNVDTELEITVPISGDIDYDWTANENYDENEDEWNAETGLEAITEPEVFGGSNYAVKMIKNAQNHLKMVREAEDSPSPSSPLEEVPATVPSPAEPTNESFNAEDYGWVLTHPKRGRSGVFTTKDDAEKVKNWNIRYAPSHYEMETSMKIVKANANDGKLDNRSKSIVESFNADAVYIAGTKDNSYETHLHIEGVKDDTGFEPIKIYDKTDSSNVSYTNASNHYDSYGKIKKDAEMDELSEDTSIIRNRVGDMVGMVELDENDEDIEKVDVDIIDDDGEMAYEGTLGAETFESQGTNTKMILGITALAVGLGLWKGKEIMSISEKITESIKNMRK